jgi:hypothetical protein
MKSLARQQEVEGNCTHSFYVSSTVCETRIRALLLYFNNSRKTFACLHNTKYRDSILLLDFSLLNCIRSLYRYILTSGILDVRDETVETYAVSPLI